MSIRRRGLVSLLLISLSVSVGAQDDEAPREPQASPIIELESRVTGNREQPQVFNVVPWQTPESPEPDYDPLERQLESVFGHVERDELQRTLRQREETVEIGD